MFSKPTSIQDMTFPPRLLSKGLKLTGECGRTYVVACPLVQSRPRWIPNVWKATDSDDDQSQFVLKQPSSDDPSGEWATFKKEIELQTLFRNSHYIRSLVAIIPPESRFDSP